MNNILFGQTNEKSLHNILKFRYEPDASFHEKECDGFIVDIKNNEKIIEIQTGSLKPMAKKLNVLLPNRKIEIIHPVAVRKTVIMTDENTGEIIRTRKSPKVGGIGEAFRAMYGIRDLLPHENLSIRIVFINLSEYRVTDINHTKSRKGYTRVDSVPTEYLYETVLKTQDDYAQLIPTGLEEYFTVRDFEKSAGLHKGEGSYAMGILCSARVIERDGKKGRAFIYKTCFKNPEYLQKNSDKPNIL